MQTGYGQNALVYVTPLGPEASESMCGVLTSGLPLTPRQSQRCWSAWMTKMLAARGGSVPAAALTSPLQGAPKPVGLVWRQRLRYDVW